MNSQSTILYPSSQHGPTSPVPVDFETDDSDENALGDDDFVGEEDEEEHHYWLHMPTAAKFLLAGGIAGAG
jgi:solute carrier family 25 (mitochondrial phosphate transporter), member 23/24/25/41